MLVNIKRLTMNKLLTIVIFVLISNLSTFADCTACWELKYVRIVLDNEKEVIGYVKWNTSWYSWLENPNPEIPKTFPENMISFYKKWKNGTAEIDIYMKIFKIGENEVWAGYFATKEDIIRVTFDKIKTIKKEDNIINNISGADKLSIFSSKSLKIITRKPNNIKKVEDTGCDIYILNYSNQINESLFNEIISKGFYDKEIELEEKDIYVLRKCYD